MAYPRPHPSNQHLPATFYSLPHVFSSLIRPKTLQFCLPVIQSNSFAVRLLYQACISPDNPRSAKLVCRSGFHRLAAPVYFLLATSKQGAISQVIYSTCMRVVVVWAVQVLLS